MIYIITASDLTRYSGDSVRIAALGSGLSKSLNGNVSLVFPVYGTKDRQPAILKEFDSGKLNLISIPVKSPIESRNGLISAIMAIRKYLKTVERKKSLVQIEGSIVGGVLASMGLRNYILDVHGIYFEELIHNYPQSLINIPYKQLMRHIEGNGFEKATTILTSSHYMKDFLVATNKVNPEKVFVVYNGFLQSLVNAQEESEEEGMVTFVGELSNWACVEKIVKAAERLGNLNVHFYIVGDGVNKPRIANLVKQYELENVTLTGRLPLKDAYRYIARSQILVCPLPKSIALDVACPIKLLEYMAFGKAILVDKVGEIPDKLQKNDAALVSDPMNDEDFVEKLRLLVENKNLRKRISRNAKRLAEDFTWDSQIARLVQVYKLLN